MSNVHTLAAAVSAVACAVAVPAQTVFVVDGLNRPGTSFLDLPAAVAAAVPGDVISVRSDGGNYTAFQTQRPLTVVASPGQAFIRATAAAPLVITNLLPGQQFTMRGFVVGPTNASGPLVQISNCAGRVALIDVDVGIGFPSVSIQSCGGVLLQGGRILGSFPAVAAQNSAVEFVQMTLQGGTADARFNQVSAPAVSLRQCRAVFAGCQVSGGLGAPTLPPSPALDVVNSTVDAAAIGGLGSLRAGPAGVGGALQSPAVRGQNATLRLDPTLPVVPTGAVPAVVGVNSVNAQFPSLVLDLRSTVGFLSAGPVAGAAEALLIGFPADPRPLPGIAGVLWLDPNATFVVFGVPPAFAIPGMPPGTTIAAQIVALSAANGAELSNVAMLAVR
jgi:hypothetical protein